MGPVQSFCFLLENMRNCNAGQILSWNIIWHPDTLVAQTFLRPCWQLNYFKQYWLWLNTSYPENLDVLLDFVQCKSWQKCESLRWNNVKIQRIMEFLFTSDFEIRSSLQNWTASLTFQDGVKGSHDGIFPVDSHLLSSCRHSPEMVGLTS